MKADGENGMGRGVKAAAGELQDIPKPSQTFVLLSLFVRPSLALLMVQLHRMWVVPALLVLLLVGIASVCRSVAAFKRYSPVAEEIVNTVAKDVAPVSIVDGRIGWRGGDNPYSVVVRDWQIDFCAECDEAVLRKGGQRKGVCVTPARVYLWLRDFPEQGQFRIDTVWKEGQIRKLGDYLAKKDDNGLDHGELVALGRMMCVVAMPAYALVMFISYFWVILLCQIIFCLTTAFMRRDGSYSFSDLVVLGVSLAFVPSLVAIVWSAAAPPSWDFHNIYFVAFVIYLLYAFHDARKGVESKADGGEES